LALPASEVERIRQRFIERVARLRATPQEVARIAATGRAFDYEAWVAEAGPADAEELAEMEELLRERDEERRRSIADERE
jgi:hypothetical protein